MPDDIDEQAGISSDEASPALTLREAVLEEKRRIASEDEKKETGGDGLLAKGPSELLRQSWLNLVDSFGLTLIWINIHVFLRMIFPKFFCRLGDEWSGAIKGVPTGDKLKGKIPEAMGLACIDLGCLFILLSLIILVALVIGVIENPLRAIYELLSTIVGNFWNKK